MLGTSLTCLGNRVSNCTILQNRYRTSSAPTCLYWKGLRHTICTMRIYLCQHGKCTTEEEDPHRPLTDSGKTEALQVQQQYLRTRKKIDLAHAFTSDKVRAVETCQMLVAGGSVFNLGNEQGIEQLPEAFKPGSDPHKAIEHFFKSFTSDSKSNVLVVGHLPHLDKLTGLLVGGRSRQDGGIVKFTNAAIVELSREGVLTDESEMVGSWKIQSVLTPDLAG